MVLIKVELKCESLGCLQIADLLHIRPQTLRCCDKLGQRHRISQLIVNQIRQRAHRANMELNTGNRSSGLAAALLLGCPCFIFFLHYQHYVLSLRDHCRGIHLWRVLANMNTSQLLFEVVAKLITCCVSPISQGHWPDAPLPQVRRSVL